MYYAPRVAVESGYGDRVAKRIFAWRRTDKTAAALRYRVRSACLRRAGCGWLMVLCAGCGATRAPTPRRMSASDGSYTDTYHLQTRAAQLFRFGALSSPLTATATLESASFRKALTRAYVADYGHALPDARRHAEAELSADSLRFLVTLASMRFPEGELGEKRSAWTPWLLCGDARWAPADIHKIVRPTPAQQVYFPSISRLRLTFRLRFDKVRSRCGAGEKIGLQFAGAYGKLTLWWDAGAVREDADG